MSPPVVLPVIWEQVSECFLPSQVVDLTLVVTTINAWNRAVGFKIAGHRPVVSTSASLTDQGAV